MALNLMLQGTMSNAGKSLLAAALCRIFKQDGYRVAPFKSQNMALNSFITAAGGEMGRAQVVQAEAAGLAPDVRMNPILLKPTTDVGSQVIVNGQVVGNMRAMEYYRRKREFLPAVLDAYAGLDREYDVLVIEGAPETGSGFSLDEAAALAERYRAEGLSRKAACKKAAAETGFSANELYDASLNE